MGPIATPAERNLLLSQRAEGANMQMITEKSQKRRKTNSNPKKTKQITSAESASNTNVVESTISDSSKKISKNKKKRKIVSSDESSEEESSNDEQLVECNDDHDDKKVDGGGVSSSDESSGSEDNEEYDIDKFTYLKNKLHYDDEDKKVYKTTRVVEENGYIVVYRKRKLTNGRFASKEERSPIYAKDVVEYTKLYDERMIIE